ncbi:MAG: EFR1 family ferrodoxin [Candidatus Methanofastidiosia archaeon]|jgi:ferredoxin
MIEIYYFSGTGNSLIVARDIAEKIHGKLIPIASHIEKKSILTDADIIGIVFPVYYNDIPVIIKRFAEKLDNINGKYIFAVCTYGGGAGDSFRSLSQIIKSRGGELSAQFGVHMPQNAFSKFWETHEPLFENWEKKLETISENINNQKKGILIKDFVWNLILFPFGIIIKPLYKKSLAKLSNSSSDMPREDLIHLADKTFSTNEKCNGCGGCAEVCPVSNIEIVDDNPVWLHHCENCLACYNWCPQKAIESEIPEKGYYYHHPEVTVSDMIKQKKE